MSLEETAAVIVHLFRCTECGTSENAPECVRMNYIHSQNIRLSAHRELCVVDDNKRPTTISTMEPTSANQQDPPAAQSDDLTVSGARSGLPECVCVLCCCARTIDANKFPLSTIEQNVSLDLVICTLLASCLRFLINCA